VIAMTSNQQQQFSKSFAICVRARHGSGGNRDVRRHVIARFVRWEKKKKKKKMKRKEKENGKGRKFFFQPLKAV